MDKPPAHSKSIYRGVEVDADLAELVRYMPAVDSTRETLQALQGVWDSLSILSELSGTGVEIDNIREAFSKLTATLVNQLGRQVSHASALELATKAQVTIDILVRNLFERTADIGFLATDDDLRQFAAAPPSERKALAPALRERLREYQRKYSVYADIALLSPDGEVLLRLDESTAVARTRDKALIDEALTTRQAYVEAYRFFDLLPGSPRSLVYASRVTDPATTSAIGVLCLVFRFEDECECIFRKFVGTNDWSVVALLDEQGRVLASSDAFQVPLGAQVAAPGNGQAHTVRFAGRRWLAASCEAHPFQGYAGPGWRGHAMTPLEHAFAVEEAERLDDATARLLETSRVLHPDGLRDIERAAQRIQSDLSRAVWNANIALSGSSQDARNAGFSRALLREIGRTGSRTREGFTHALTTMSGSIAAATLSDARSRAALAIDIMDRSLYERANDCRWWALTTRFRKELESAASPDAAALGKVLRVIHGLYTVYANLVLFDRQGCILAVSQQNEAAAPGIPLVAEWVQRTLRLPGPQSYCVSNFEPSSLYGGRPTYIYAAAVRGLQDPNAVVGGIAVVFDSAPQFRSMLQDTLPRNAQGAPQDGAFGVFVDGKGRVIACSHDDPAIGSELQASGAMPRGGTDSAAAALAWRGRWYAAGAGRSTGYREFKGPQDPYRESVTALVFEALTDDMRSAAAASDAPPPMPHRSPAARTGAERVDLAMLRIGVQWHALLGSEVVEAVRADNLLPLPGSPAHVRGSIMFRNQAIAVLEIDRLLGQPADAPAPQQRQIVVVRPRQGRGRSFGLLVDALGDNPQVTKSQLVRLTESAWQRGPGGTPLIDTLVAPAPGSSPDQELLTLLSAPALEALG